MNKKTKILCVCRWGNIRSVAMARLLKKQGYDALAGGINAMQYETLDMLCNWADVILFAMEEFMEFVPGDYYEKFIDMEIGHDIWKDADHPDLLKLVERRIYANKAQFHG